MSMNAYLRSVAPQAMAANDIAALRKEVERLCAALMTIRDGHLGDQTAEQQYLEAQRIAREALRAAP